MVRRRPGTVLSAGTRSVNRGWRRPGRLLLAAATIACLGLLTAPPASAQWSQQYWFGQLKIHKAWQVSKGAGITVAVVGSGVPDTLGDIKGQVLPGADFSGKHTDGRSDPGEQCDRLGCYSHGLEMALDIAGTGRGSGFEGVAPRARILPVKVQSTSRHEAASPAVAKGIRWAVDHGAQIINVSLQAPIHCETHEGAAVKYAYDHGAIVVAAAGNNGLSFVGSPASCPGALAVSATSGGPKNGVMTVWSGSNYGPQIAFAGNGVQMPQELTTGKKVLGGNGTSQATAITSGVLALIWSHFPEYTARQVVTRAIWNVHTGAGSAKLGTRINNKIGYGQILPYYAMTRHIPAHAANPIYDRWAKTLGAQSKTAAPHTPTSSTGSGITAPTPQRTTAASSSSNTGMIIGVVVGVIVLILIAAGLVLYRRRSADHPHR